jgi:serine/threonine protein kinase
MFGRSKQRASDPKDDSAVVDFSLKPLFDSDFGLTHLDLLETISTGLLGRTRLVKSLLDKKYYALKCVKKGRVVKQKQFHHCMNEVKILSRCRCPFAINLHAVFQDDSALYLLQEYVPGGELFSHLRREGHFDTTRYKFYIVEIISAIHYLHSLRIMHRDIKPENILINRNGHIRLCEFAFAKIMDKEERTFTLCGTVEYMSPEQVQGTGHSLAVDWWTVGILLFEMAVGYPPFFAENPFAVYRQILDGIKRVKFPVSISKPSAAAIKAFLAPKASRLGCGSGGFDSVKSHPFFKGIVVHLTATGSYVLNCNCFELF